MSKATGSSASSDYGLIADAIYNHCRENHGPDDLLQQDDLLKPDIIPNKDLDLLLQVCQLLVNQHLFKTHDVRSGGIGWKLRTKEIAEKYDPASR